jgi:hypothetical protein
LVKSEDLKKVNKKSKRILKSENKKMNLKSDAEN